MDSNIFEYIWIYSFSNFCFDFFNSYLCWNLDITTSSKLIPIETEYLICLLVKLSPSIPLPQVDPPTLIGPVNLKFVWCLPNVIVSPFKLFEYYSNFFLTEYEYEYIRLKILNRIRIRIYSVWKFQPNTNTNIIRFLKSTE